MCADAVSLVVGDFRELVRDFTGMAVFILNLNKKVDCLSSPRKKDSSVQLSRKFI